MTIKQASCDDHLIIAYKETMRTRLRAHGMTANYQRYRCRDGSFAIYVSARRWAWQNSRFEGYLGRLDVLATMSTEDFDALITSKRKEQQILVMAKEHALWYFADTPLEEGDQLAIKRAWVDQEENGQIASVAVDLTPGIPDVQIFGVIYREDGGVSFCWQTPKRGRKQ